VEKRRGAATAFPAVERREHPGVGELPVAAARPLDRVGFGQWGNDGCGEPHI